MVYKRHGLVAIFVGANVSARVVDSFIKLSSFNKLCSSSENFDLKMESKL